MIQMFYLQNRKTVTDLENKFMVTTGKRRASLMAQGVESLPAMQETRV